MSDIMKPAFKQKVQKQTTASVTSDSTIMDDTVVTMDSASALMGRPTVISEGIKMGVKPFRVSIR